MSCLITEHRQYNDVDYPPSIIVSPGSMYQANVINTVPLSSPLGSDGGPPAIHLDFVVRDPNVDQRLTAHVIYNAPASNPSPAAITYRMDGAGALDRPFGFDVPLTDLDSGLTPNVCKKVEVWVSGNFADGTRTPLPPGNPDDVASVTLWFAISDGTATINMGDCP